MPRGRQRNTPAREGSQDEPLPQDQTLSDNREQENTPISGQKSDSQDAQTDSAPAYPREQGQIPAPDEQNSPIPLNVRITSLEMDGSTRAFAAAEYGDLTINRIRIKQDEYGAQSVAMPRFRQTGGWREICSFNTAEARNRLSGAVLDAYDRQMAQIQGQGQTAAEPQIQGQDEAQDFDRQEQGGPVMGMSQCCSPLPGHLPPAVTQC